MNDTRKWLTVLTIGCSVAALSPACATLPDITQGTCGNKVLEAHEDCDTFPNDASAALTCGTPGSVNECRFEATDVSACPQKTPAYVLGLDGVCRQPSNRFREGLHLPSIQGVRLTAAEFDGDGISDLFVVPADHSRREIAYMNELGVAESLFVSAGPLLSVTPGSLDGDEHATNDLVIPAAGGIAALLGLTSRGFSPKLYAPVPSARAHAFAMPLSILGKQGGFESAGSVRPFVAMKVGVCFAIDCNDSQLVALENLNGADWDPDKAITTFGALDGPSALPLLAYGRAGSNVLRVVRITTPGDPPKVDTLSLTLPNDRFLGPAIAISDANGDGYLDLITSAVSGDGFHSELYVAFGPAAVPAPGVGWTTGMQLTVAGPDLFGARLLAAGQFNDDKLTDYILDRFVFVSSPPLAGGYQTLQGSADQTAWRGAVVADLNGDGLDDAVMASGSAGLDVLLGGKGLLVTRGRLPAPAGMKTLGSGDLDGDGSKDIIASTLDHPDCDADQQLVAYYGRALALPEGPFLVAEAPAIRQITPLYFGDPTSGLGDGMSDLVVFYGQAKDGHCLKNLDQGGLVFGAADRQPLSPFVTRDETKNHDIVQPFVTTVGDGDGDGVADIVSLSLLSNNDNNDNTLDLGLAFARGLGGGELQTPIKIPSVVGLATHTDFLPSSAALAIGGAGPGGISDVLVALPRYADCSGTSACRLALDASFYRFEGGAFVAHDIPLPGGDTVHAAIDRNDFIEPPRVVVDDIDGDGDKDFVVSFVFQEKKGEMASASGAFIFRNEQGSYVPERVDSPDPTAIVDLAVAKDANGVRPHLLAATRRGVYAVEGKEKRLLFRVRASDSSSTGGVVAGVGGGVPAPPGLDQRIISITTGDVTGDQLEDVVILTDEGAIIYEQLAAIVSDDAPLFSLNPADRL